MGKWISSWFNRLRGNRSQKSPEDASANSSHEEQISYDTAPGTIDGMPAVWQPGETILDLYQVLDVLGEGGMGVVYKVHHKGWNTDLAVKSPRPQIFSQSGGLENFERECETWANLGLHPHTVSCYYVRRVEGIPRVFAEYVEGGNLQEWIEDGRLYKGGSEQALKRILDVAIQFAWGLQHAHEAGLIHQDVKPANVMMTSDGIVKVTDFGLVKARAVAGEAMDGPHTIMAGYGGMTRTHCSPEQADADAKARAGVPREEWPELTRRTDIWSWAVSVLEMFSGEVRLDPREEAGQIAGGQFESFLEQGPDAPGIPSMPESAVELLRQCFRQNPQERPADMLALANALIAAYGEAYPRGRPAAGEARAASLNNRAVSLLDLGKREEAERLWEEALLLEPHHLESTYNLGLLWWRTGRMTDEALLRDLRETKAMTNDRAHATVLHARVLLESDACERAVLALEGLEDADVKREEVVALLTEAQRRLPTSRRCLRTIELGMLLIEHNVVSVKLSVDGSLALSGCNNWIRDQPRWNVDNSFALPESSRDYTLNLWEVATGECIRTFEGHTKAVNSVCLSTDNSFALSGSNDHTLKLWEVATGECLHTFEGHTNVINSVCLSVDGRFALSGSHDQTLKLWEVATGECLHTFEGHTENVTSVCLSADGRFALSGSYDKTLKWWEVATGQCIRTFNGHLSRVTSISLSADSRFALSGSYDKTLKLWEVATGQCIRTFEGHTDAVSSVGLSADGRFALSNSKLWEVATGKCLHTFEGLSLACLSANGRIVLSMGNKGIELWEAAGNADTLFAPAELSRIVTSTVAFSASISYAKYLKEGREALSRSDTVTAMRAFQEARRQSGYERDRHILDEYIGLYSLLRLSRLSGGWESGKFEGHTRFVNTVCLSADGRFALSGSWDYTLKLWDVATGQSIRTFEGHTGLVNTVCLSADGRFALSGSEDKTLKLWEMTTGQCIRTFEGNKFRPVNSICLSADGRFALSGDDNSSMKLWDVTTSECLRTFDGTSKEIETGQNFPIYNGHQGRVTSISLSADSRCALSGSYDSTLKLWDVATGEYLRTFEGHRDTVVSVCLSVDGRFALSGSYDRRLKLWEVATGKCLRTFEGDWSLVNSVCLSADGRFALSGSDDHTLKLWEVATGKCLRTFEGHTDKVRSVCLSVDNSFALSGSYDLTIKRWFLDWELEEKEPADWDEEARPYLHMFLSAHVPYAGQIPTERKPTKEEITIALTRRGRPAWSEEEFNRLLHTLGCAGFGWLRSEGVRHELEKMASVWQGPPPL